MVGEGGGRYDGDHLDFRGGEFKGVVVAKGNVHQHAAIPTALDALPARVTGFTGRGDELRRLLDAFDPAAAGSGSAVVPVLVAALSGLGGIGKTALAVEAAHEACQKGWFPGGVLFLDLHGYDEDPVAGAQALEALLRALGVEPEHIPVGADERGALYRSLLAKRGRERGAVLVLADNASSSEQVRPLLPGDPRHRLLVTSRSKMPQLGARLLALYELRSGEAYDLLDRALRIADPADRRVANEAEAAVQLASRCGHLPLALQIAAALLVLDRDKPVAELAAEFAEFRDRLTLIDDGERSVRAAFELSYRRLPDDQARLLRLLALAPGAEVTTEAATALIGTDVPTRSLDALARAHLVERGSGRGQWRLHDLVRAFGAGVVMGDADLWEEGEEARARLLTFYYWWADAADDRLRWLPGMPVPERFGTRAEALEWLDKERAGLVGAAQWTHEEWHADTAARLALCLGDYLSWRRYFDDWITVSRAARDAANRVGNDIGEAMAWNNLGNALQEADRAEEAIDAHMRARDLFQAEGDQDGEAMTWNNVGNALRVTGRVAEAIDAQTSACELFQTMGDHVREAMAWNNLGNALRDAGRADEAIDAHMRARDLFQAVGDRHGEARAWNNLGIALRLAARVEEAIEAHGQSLKTRREFEDWYGTGMTLAHLARAHEVIGSGNDARDYYIQAADAYLRADVPDRAAECRTWADEVTP